MSSKFFYYYDIPSTLSQLCVTENNIKCQYFSRYHIEMTNSSIMTALQGHERDHGRVWNIPVAKVTFVSVVCLCRGSIVVVKQEEQDQGGRKGLRELRMKKEGREEEQSNPKEPKLHASFQRREQLRGGAVWQGRGRKQYSAWPW